MDKTVEAVGGLPAGVRSGRGAAGTKLVLFLALLPVACVAGADPAGGGTGRKWLRPSRPIAWWRASARARSFCRRAATG